MRSKLALSLTLCLLVVSPLCSFAQWHGFGQQSSPLFRIHGMQHHRAERQPNDCDIQRLTATEPNRRIKAEAGVTEVWDLEDEQFQCAGVAVVRHVIEPRGLFLPSYTNAPYVTYVVRGRGVQGIVLPGCPETYESSRGEHNSRREREREEEGEREREKGRPERRGREEERGSSQEQGRFRDQHQKVRRVRQGDVIASPAGVVQWTYNDGDRPIVSISVFDLANFQNQLDQNLRDFYLAGNPESVQEQGNRREQHRDERTGQQERSRREGGSQKRRGEQENSNNILSGFDEELLSEALNVETETVRKLQSRNDKRGNIVRVEEDLQFLSPEFEDEEEGREGGRRERRTRPRRGRRSDEDYDVNGFEETFCTQRLHHNIDRASEADLFSPRGGHLFDLNSQKLSVLDYLQLSVQKVHLYRNAIMAPHWNINAHAVVYITNGAGRIQIARENGQLVFDDTVQEGQVLVVPQNFVVLKRAGRDGLEYVAFKTDANAMINPIVGRVSAFRGLPDEVLMNSYDLSREDARRVKYSRQEIALFSPAGRSRELEKERQMEAFAIV